MMGKMINSISFIRRKYNNMDMNICMFFVLYEMTEFVAA